MEKKKRRSSVTFQARIAAKTAPSEKTNKWRQSVRRGYYAVSKVFITLAFDHIFLMKR